MNIPGINTDIISWIPEFSRPFSAQNSTEQQVTCDLVYLGVLFYQEKVKM